MSRDLKNIATLIIDDCSEVAVFVRMLLDNKYAVRTTPFNDNKLKIDILDRIPIEQAKGDDTE